MPQTKKAENENVPTPDQAFNQGEVKEQQKENRTEITDMTGRLDTTELNRGGESNSVQSEDAAFTGNPRNNASGTNHRNSREHSSGKA